jgi:hypothetical protein
MNMTLFQVGIVSKDTQGVTSVGEGIGRPLH